MNSESSSVRCAQPPSLIRAWGNALAITLLGCVLLGLGCFVVLGRLLPQRMDLFHAAVWQQVGFGVALTIIWGVIVAWQRVRGLTLADLGWGRPTTLGATAEPSAVQQCSFRMAGALTTRQEHC